jgi:GAF domain-containing protein
MAHL